MGRPTEVRIRVPGSTANLGPGFDSFGLALALYDEIEVCAVSTPGVTVEVSGEGEGRVPLGPRHLVVRAMHQAFELFGTAPAGIRLRCTNTVPHSRGLGSSAAAAVSGVVAAAVLSGRDVDDEHEALLQLSAGIEGHADNAAASLLGGFVLAWETSGAARRFHAEKLAVHPGIRPVACVASTESATKTTRGLLPERVPHADAAFTGSRTALGVLAMTARPDLLLPATEDRLHQPYRRPAYPESLQLVEWLRAREIPAAVSGAGPTVVALTTDGRLPDGAERDGFTVLDLPVDADGIRVDRG